MTSGPNVVSRVIVMTAMSIALPLSVVGSVPEDSDRPVVAADMPKPADAQSARLAQGQAIAFSRSRGNCLACHHIEGGEMVGNFGPPLIMMRARYPDRDALRAQIWDASVKNPETRMPPFGRNRILTDVEIDLVTDFLRSL